MDWIDKLNKELEERREHNSTSEAKQEAEERRKKWAASQGGKTTIDTLLEWQEKNNHNIGEIAKNKSDRWKSNISKANQGKTLSEEHKQNVSNGMKSYASTLSEEERKNRFGMYGNNNPMSQKAYTIRKEILDSIENDTFNTSQIRKACEEYGLGNWKGLLKDKRLVKQIHKGTNQNNPSIYRKIYLEN